MKASLEKAIFDGGGDHQNALVRPITRLESEPPGLRAAALTRQWVIWHLVEHDLHHGGEISITLETHGLRGLNLGWQT